MSSKGYPDKFKKNILIKNLENYKDFNNQYIFHAGTKYSDKQFYSTGGRVLNFVSIDNEFKNEKEKYLKFIKKLNWKNGHYRKDIGYKVIQN